MSNRPMLPKYRPCITCVLIAIKTRLNAWSCESNSKKCNDNIEHQCKSNTKRRRERIKHCNNNSQTRRKSSTKNGNSNNWYTPKKAFSRYRQSMRLPEAKTLVKHDRPTTHGRDMKTPNFPKINKNVSN